MADDFIILIFFADLLMLQIAIAKSPHGSRGDAGEIQNSTTMLHHAHADTLLQRR